MKIVNLAQALCPGCRQKIIGIRPGEKLHETLVPSDHGIYTYEFKDRFITYPKVAGRKNNKKRGIYLGPEFKGYRSDNNLEWLNLEQLRKLAKLERY